MLRNSSTNQAAQQLLSLSNWWMQRTFASASDKAVKFAKDRKSYENNLSELRKSWALIEQERAAKQLAQEQADEQRRQAAKAKRATSQADKQKAVELLKQQQAEDRRTRLEAKTLRLKRQELRQDVLGVAKDERRQWLLHQSKHWIAPEDLDRRIDEALESPLPLFSTNPTPTEKPRH